MRDAEAQRRAQEAEEKARKEKRRAAAKQATADKTPQERYSDEQSVQKMLGHVEGSKLQGERLKKEAVEKRKNKAYSRKDLDNRVADDRERRMEKVYAYDAEQKAREEALKRIKREEQDQIDKLHAYFADGDYTKFGTPNDVIGDEAGEHNDKYGDGFSGIVIEEDENLPKQEATMKMAQIRERAEPRKERPRARKSGVKSKINSDYRVAKNREKEEKATGIIPRIKESMRGIDESLEGLTQVLADEQEQENPHAAETSKRITLLKEERRKLEIQLADLNLLLRGKKWQ